MANRTSRLENRRVKAWAVQSVVVSGAPQGFSRFHRSRSKQNSIVYLLTYLLTYLLRTCGFCSCDCEMMNDPKTRSDTGQQL